jgi:Zn-dependent peptidase ImmA (M78 family)
MTHIFDLLKKHNITKINLGYATYKIIISEEIPDDNSWGYTNTDTYSIYLYKNMEDQPARETLVHEITHAMFEIIGFTSDDEEKTFCETNEDLTIKVSRGMMILFRLNPSLMTLICEDINHD